MVRLLSGALKGAIIGGGLGYGAYHYSFSGALWSYILCAAVGLACGLFIGRPFWSHLLDKESTAWTALMKALVGGGIGAGLCALARNFAPSFDVSLFGETRSVIEWPFLLAGVVGVVYGIFMEIDDAPRKKKREESA